MNLKELIKQVETVEVPEDDAEARAMFSKLARIAHARLVSKSSIEFNEPLTETYIDDLLAYTTNLSITDYPVCPNVVKDKQRSTTSTKLISAALDDKEFDISTALLKLCYKEILKSKTVGELKVSCKIYRQALVDSYRYKASQKLLEDYEQEAGDLEKEFTQGKEYKRQLDEIYNVISADDYELNIAIKAKRLKADQNLSMSEIASILSLSKRKLQTIISKIELT